jgi:hypothetical protein
MEVVVSNEEGTADDVQIRSDFNNSYAALQAIFSGWAKESGYGAEWNGVSGDYFIVDDFHRYHHKLYLWKWSMFSSDLIRRIRIVLAADFEKWDVMVQVLTDEMTTKTPIMGMIVSARRVTFNVADEYKLTYLRSLDFAKIEELTKPE